MRPKIAGLKKWKIWEKEGRPDVARYVTGAYFGLPKYAPALDASFFPTVQHLVGKSVKLADGLVR